MSSDEGSRSLSPTTIGYILAGVAIFLALIVAAAWYFVRRRKQQLVEQRAKDAPYIHFITPPPSPKLSGSRPHSVLSTLPIIEKSQMAVQPLYIADPVIIGRSPPRPVSRNLDVEQIHNPQRSPSRSSTISEFSTVSSNWNAPFQELFPWARSLRSSRISRHGDTPQTSTSRRTSRAQSMWSNHTTPTIPSIPDLPLPIPSHPASNMQIVRASGTFGAPTITTRSEIASTHGGVDPSGFSSTLTPAQSPDPRGDRRSMFSSFSNDTHSQSHSYSQPSGTSGTKSYLSFLRYDPRFGASLSRSDTTSTTGRSRPDSVRTFGPDPQAQRRDSSAQPQPSQERRQSVAQRAIFGRSEKARTIVLQPLIPPMNEPDEELRVWRDLNWNLGL